MTEGVTYAKHESSRALSASAADRLPLITWSPILGLLFLCGPATVLWGIGTVVVDPVYGVARAWSLAHISDERFKRMAPAVTDADSSTSVVVPTIVIGICAATDDVYPCAVFRSDSPWPRLAVSPLSLRGAFTLKAATALRVSSAQICLMNGQFSAAFASADPRRESSSLFIKAQDGESAKHVALMIDLHHSIFSRLESSFG